MKRRLRLGSSYALLLALTLLFALSPALPIARASLSLHGTSAPATNYSFTVDSTVDAPDAHPGDGICADSAGKCTVRAAIQEASALPAGSTIAITVPAGTYGLTRGTLQLTANHITISGAASSTTILNGNNTSNIMSIASTVQASLSGVTITGGNAGAGNGGGIDNHGTLSLTSSTITNNATASGGFPSGSGGGIWSSGPSNITSSTVSGNTTGNGGTGTIGGNGGDGAATWSSGPLKVTNSTMSGNTTGNGGTGSHGGHRGVGGGIKLTSGTTTLAYSTIAANSDGIANLSGTIALTGTIVANSTAGPNCTGAITEGHGYNLDSGNSCGLSKPSDLSNHDPVLGPLADNGGPTTTMALLTGSPAIDEGGPHAIGCPLTDQRGVARPDEPTHSAACDMGAYESQGIG